MVKTDFHADDYALTENTSLNMLECMQAGKLDSISIVPNMSCFGQCMEMLYEQIPSLPFLPLMSVHLDFVEGRSLAKKGEVPLLVKGDTGLMGLSWGGLFTYSYLPGKRRQVKEQLKREIKAQILRTQEAVNKCVEIAKKHGIACGQEGLRLDSHQHAHMIPVVWEAVLEVVKEEGWQLSYIRNSKEVMGVFLAEKGLRKTYRSINFVKNRLLWFYSHKVDRYCSRHDMEQMYLWGLIMSGRMDHGRIMTLYPKMIHRAGEDRRTLEILFHPGLTLGEEVTEEIGKEAVKTFYMCPDREVEKDTVLRLERDKEKDTQLHLMAEESRRR